MRAQDFLSQELNEDLRKWFKEKWVRFGPDGKIRGDCARGSESEGKPKCLPQSKAHALGKKGRASAAARKRREDPNPERRGPAKNVATKKNSNEALIREVQNKMFHEVLADRLPANIVNDNDIVKSAWEITAQKMGPARATRLFREVPGFEYDLIAAYRAKHSVNENSNQNLSDAQSLARQIRDFMDEHYNLQRSGRKDADTLAAINMSKRSVSALNQELQQLGYKYAPTAPGLVALKGAQYVEEGAEQCPHCGGPMFSNLLLAEKKDACYNKVRSRYKVWPSAYASGALVQCRKKGAANWGNKSEGVAEGSEKNPHTSALGKALYRDLSKQPKLSPQQVQRNKERWAKRQAEREQGVAEGAPIVVAQAPIDVRNPKKAPQPYRNQGDIVPDTKPPSTEKRGVKGRPGQRPMPNYDEGVAEANPNQQVSRWHPETSTYRGSMNKIPTSTSVDVDDITARGQQVDFPTHHELARNANIENPEDVVYKSDLKKLVQQHFKSLPNNIREVLKMRFWDGMTLEQTAKKLSVSAAHVRQLEAKGFRMLAHSDRLGQVYEADQLDERCWDTHKQVGMKKKGDRMVPNCVPKESATPKSTIGAAIAQVRR